MHLSKIINGVSIISVFAVILIFFFHPIPLDIENSDLGRHLLLGEIISTSGSVPKTNLLSYTYPDYPFVNTHWLSEVLFYMCFRLTGFNGLLLASVILIMLAFSIIFLPAVKRFGVFTSVIISLIYLQIISDRTQIRPELFSFLFLSVYITILYRYREQYTRWIFALIPLQLFWVNSHIYFVIGIGVLMLFLIDDIFVTTKTISSNKTRVLILVTAIAGLVTIFNPNLIKGALYPIFVLNDYGLSVQENSNLFTAISLYKDHLPTFMYFSSSVLALWAFILVSRKKMASIDIFLALFFTFLGIIAIRNFPLFVFGTFFIAVKSVWIFTVSISKPPAQRTLLVIKTVLFVVTFIIIFPHINSNIIRNDFGFGTVDNLNDATKLLINNNISGRIYNNFDVGNYLAYRFYPRQHVFVDGRPEAYPKGFFNDIYYPMSKDPLLFQQQSKKYDFNVIYFTHTSFSSVTDQFLASLVKSNDWKIIYLNHVIVVFVKNTPTNSSIIKSNGINENNIQIKGDDIEDGDQAIHLANFFRAVGWIHPQLAMTIRYLDFNPTNCPALENAASIAHYLKDPNASLYIDRYKLHCR